MMCDLCEPQRHRCASLLHRLKQKPEYSDRTSYVIAPDGNVIYAYHADDPDHHAEYTMKAVADWKAAK